MALEHHDRQKEARGRGKVFVALLIVSASFNIGLAHALGARYARLNPDDVLRQGARMTPIQATSRDGRPITYAFSGSEQPTLLYVFRSNCEWCDVNVRSIRALSDAIAARYHVLGLDVSTIDARATATHTFGFDVLTNPKNGEAYHRYGLPYTCVVMPSGVVEQCWRGAFT